MSPTGAFSEVFQAEVDELRKRRRQCLPPSLALPEGQDAPAEPSTNLGLVGLALSGGGIRSASFSLGVVQKLAAARLLKSIDYLSTVSGGGYLGASLSSLLSASSEEALEPGQFPLRKEEGKLEPPALSHLRNGSNYLNPPGVLNLLGLPSVLLRGFLLTVISLLPLILLAVALTELFYEVINPFLSLLGIDIELSSMDWSFPTAVGGFVLLAVLFPFALVILRRWMSLRSRGLYQKAMALMLLLTLGLIVLRPVLMLVNLAAYLTPKQAGELLNLYVWPVLDSPAAWAAFLLPLLLLAVFRLGRKVLKVLGTALAAISGPLALFGVYIALCLWQVNPPRQVNLDEKAVHSLKKDSYEDIARRVFEPLPEPHPQFAPVARELRHSELLRNPHAVRLDGTTLYVGWQEGSPVAVVWGTPFDTKGLAFLALTALLLLINYRFLNINFTSPHTFYRDQLSRLFLMKEDGARVLPNDALKLSALRGGKEGLSCAPYHLINGTVNLDSDKDHALRGRNGAVFLFSKLYAGSQQTGWCRTEELEKVDPHLDLGTAMSISAAAAAPSMGAYTSRAFSFLLMLLNIRLGYWLPNPALLKSPASFWRRPFWGAGPRYLLKEALGPLECNDRYINVSDGGHIENLGLYELLRRRCKLIVAVDGEADPEMRFGGLVTLLRFAEIDMGIRIDIDLSQFRKTDGLSQAHWAHGIIHYGEREEGDLFYIKASLTGDENPYVRAYREANPTFPHESTADQFFTETQLEAYRALGEHAAAGLVKELEEKLPAPSPMPKATESRSPTAAA